MDPGHPELVAAIAEEIQHSGPIPFARFMELALYHPRFGYYMRAADPVAAEHPAEDRIGWHGDYYTSADVHPVLAQALARQVRQVDGLLGHPESFTLVEMGAGKGLLARDFLAACAASPGSFFGRLHYVLIERSPAMRASQRTHLAPWLGIPGKVSWLDSLETMESGRLVGVLFSNELVDALPAHRIRIERGETNELFVGYEDGRFCECLRPLSTPALSEHLARLAQLDITLAERHTAEINVHALAWMREVARVLGRGVVITVDYGHTAQDLYDPARSRGTFLCYYGHMVSEDPYTRVGRQDMTTHVDFTSLATVGEDVGLHVTGFTNQMSFLIGLGVEQVLDSLEPGSAAFQSVLHLLRPEGMGGTFKILIQHKGLDQPELDGLRYKPFFGDALSLARSAHG